MNGVTILSNECGFFETLAPTSSTGITSRLIAPEPISGAAQGGNAAYITLASGFFVPDAETRVVGRRIRITSGTGIGQVAVATAFTQSNDQAASVWGTAPDNTSKYRIESDFDGMFAKSALIVVETNSIRFRLDGVAPAAGVGQILTAGQSMLIQGVENVRKFRCIDVSGASSVSVHVYF